MADLRERASETHRLFKPAEGSAADGAIAEDMELLELDVFGKGSVFDPHHVQPLDTFGPETKQRPPYDADLLGAMLDHYCAGYACKPMPEQLLAWARAGRVPDSRYRATIREFFIQFDGEDLLDLKARGGMSLYEMARLMVHCEVTHWLSVEFVNQWSELGSNPLPEGVEKLAMHGGLDKAW